MDEEQVFDNEEIQEESLPEPDSTLGENAKIEYDTKGKEATGILDAAAKRILKKYKISIILVGGIIFLIILIVQIVFFASDSYDYQTVANACQTVTITYDPYGPESDRTTTMSLENYVASAVYAYSELLYEDIRYNYGHFYRALAIAIRTEAVANDCEVTYRDKTLSTNYEKNNLIEDALNTSAKLVLVDDNDEFVDVKINDFCWNTTSETNYLLEQNNPLNLSSSLEYTIPSDFINEHLTNNIYATCPCNEPVGDPLNGTAGEYDHCWITWDSNTDDDDPSDNEKEWLHQDEGVGFSVMGAFYLAAQEGMLRDTILEHFYGDQVYIKTIGESDDPDSSLGYDNGNSSSLCNTSSSTANLITFLDAFEGSGSYCDNGNGYLAYDGNDNTITIGHGVTNFLIGSNYATNYINQNNWGEYFHSRNGTYYINEGDCLPTSVIDQLKLYSIEVNYAAPIERYAEAYGVTLTQYQKDALTSFNYNLGTGYTENLIAAYANGGYEGLWNYMKQFYHSNGRELDGLRKRRKAEFALFVTGDYTDQGLFYMRGLDNYDDYDSENVMAREAICSTSVSGFSLPLPTTSGFSCSSPFGYRIHPIEGKGEDHSGLDLAVAGGTDVLAAKDGVVVARLISVTGSTPSTGNMVRIRHDDGTMTDYYHMQYHSITVSVGERVTAGQVIGKVGATGAATGNHLHFTIYDANGNLVDPYNYLDLSMLSDTSLCHM